MTNLKVLIESIIEDLANDVSIAPIMLKAQTIAFYIKDKAFANWINAEQNGYANIRDLPEYRKVKCGIKVNVSMPYRGIYTNIDVPIDAIKDEKTREWLSSIRIWEPLSEVEEMCKGDLNGILKVNVPAFAYQTINLIFPYGNVEGAWIFTNKSSALTIVSIVKSKLLDFFLNIEKEIKTDLSFDVLANKEKIQTIVNQTIKAGFINAGTGNISISDSEVLVCGDSVVLSSSNKEILREIINEIESKISVYDNEDLKSGLRNLKSELSKSQQSPRTMKRFFDTMKEIAVSIFANELTPLIDKGLAFIASIM